MAAMDADPRATDVVMEDPFIDATGERTGGPTTGALTDEQLGRADVLPSSKDELASLCKLID